MLKSLFENSRTAMMFAVMVLVCAAMISGMRIVGDKPGDAAAPETPAASASPAPAPSEAAEPGSRSDWYGPEPTFNQNSEDEDGPNIQSDTASSSLEGARSESSVRETPGPVYGPDGKVLPANPLATVVPGNDDD